MAAVGLTWDLWNSRSFPPLLPAAEWLPDISMGIPMLSSLVLSLVWPRLGTGLHTAVLTYAVLLDQIRLQPEFISLALVMSTLAFPSLTFVGRAHLATLWVWAGTHKLLSLGFAAGGAAFIARGFGLPAGVARWVTPLAEIVTGLLALSWRTRYAAVVMSFVVHALILLTLVAQDWNSAVWPWNVALPIAATFLFLEGREGHVVSMLRRAQPMKPLTVALALVVWILFWLYPAGFYVDSSDAYLAHNLYTSNTRTAAVCTTVGEDGSASSLVCRSPFGSTWTALNVPMPPETRLFRQWFDGTCSEGEVLQVSPIRTRITSSQVQEYVCPIE